MDTTLLSIALAASMILMLALGVWVSLTLVGIGVLGLLLSGNDQIVAFCSQPPVGVRAPAGR